MTDSGSQDRLLIAGKRRILIAGNWKLQKTSEETNRYIRQLASTLPESLDVDVALAPAYVCLESAVKAAEGSPIRIAAQNVFYEESGAYTGEVSVGMLTGLGVNMVIIGHSERRQLFHETNETVNKRIKAALSSRMTVILCIGETLDQREAGQTFDLLKTQLIEGLEGIDHVSADDLTIAYEPVWAIGTGKTATTEQAQVAHEFIRGCLAEIVNKKLASSIRILYGGSVKPENAVELLSQADIDGALVGGASLDPATFLKIITSKGA